jgi:hypothetical protein
MSQFELVSHEMHPEDNYITESAVVCIDGKYRVTFLKKKMQTGGMFWDVPSTAVMQGGVKKYLKSVEFDSNFLKSDILKFLDGLKAKEQNDDSIPF